MQIDETKTNFKCKNHRSCTFNNTTDAFYIVEFKNNITKFFATIIQTKNQDFYFYCYKSRDNNLFMVRGTCKL